MWDRPRRIIMLVILGIIVGLWFIFIGVSSPHITSLIVGLICFLLSYGLFMLWNWARVTALIFSLIFFCIYIMLIIATVMKVFQGFAGIALFFHFPLLMLCLLYIDNLNRKEIKAQFHKQA